MTEQTQTNSPEQTQQQAPFISAFDQPDIAATLEKTKLAVSQLAHIPQADKIPASTKRIKPLNDFLGQERARASVEAGIGLPYSGYNIFAVGTAGLGKRTMIKRLLQQHAKNMPTPPDWVYVNNFVHPRQPIALQLPAGQASKFQSLIHQTWQTILKQLQRRFSAEIYHNRVEGIRQQTGHEQQHALVQLTKEGAELDLKLVTHHDEHRFVPAQYKDSKMVELSQSEMNTLSPQQQTEIASNMRYMDKKTRTLRFTFRTFRR